VPTLQPDAKGCSSKSLRLFYKYSYVLSFQTASGNLYKITLTTSIASCLTASKMDWCNRDGESWGQ
ncbi:hypothetical protein Tco_0426855, partial [Tanacetum coccineum]